MIGMWRRAITLLAGLALIGALTACGISGGGVLIDGPGERGGAGPPEVGSEPSSRPEHIDDPVELVLEFLKASAGDPDKRESRLQTFLAPETTWEPGNEVNLIRIDGDPDKVRTDRGSHAVTVRLKVVGVLDRNGLLQPRSDSEWQEETFDVVNVSGERGLFLGQLPSDIMLSEDGLADYYDRTLLYFAPQSGNEPVPDLRWMPKVYPEDVALTRLAEWLLGGPAEWLKPGVQAQPDTRLEGKVTRSDEGDLIIDLADAISDAQKQQLIKQLGWTLQPETGLQLLVQGQADANGAAFAWAADHVKPEQFVVVNGSVRRIGSADRVGLTDEVNSGVVTAALAAREQGYALVRAEGDTLQLHIGGPGDVQPTELSGEVFTQPVWLDHEAAAVLVIRDGSLYHVQRDGKYYEVSHKFGDSARLTAISVSPDGQRIAVVADGKLRLATLLHREKVELGAAQAVPTELTDLHDVAFAGITDLVIAGTAADGEVGLATLTLDGAVQAVHEDRWQSGLRITNLVADPWHSTVLFEVNNQARQLSQLGSEEINRDQLPGLPDAEPDAGPIEITAPSFAG